MYDGEFLNWERIWSSFKNLDITNNIKDFQWKCLYNIVYTDSRLQTQALVTYFYFYFWGRHMQVVVNIRLYEY
jgi:hypothetical protein